jgi:hypothetical protein
VGAPSRVASSTTDTLAVATGAADAAAHPCKPCRECSCRLCRGRCHTPPPFDWSLGRCPHVTAGVGRCCRWPHSSRDTVGATGDPLLPMQTPPPSVAPTVMVAVPATTTAAPIVPRWVAIPLHRPPIRAGAPIAPRPSCYNLSMGGSPHWSVHHAFFVAPEYDSPEQQAGPPFTSPLASLPLPRAQPQQSSF